MSFHNHEHNHAHAHSTNTRILRVSLAVIAGFMLVEAAAGWLSGSLALLSDAGHMFSDAASLALALFAFKWAEQAANSQKSYGYQRVEILAAALNGLTLVVMAAWILVEAVIRAFKPVPVAGGAMLAVAVLGLLVNLFVAWYMLRGEKDNLNMRGAFLHVVGDLLGSVAAVAAGLLIQFYGWNWADLAASAVVALLIGKSGWGVLSGSLHILMEGAPKGTDLVKNCRRHSENQRHIGRSRLARLDDYQQKTRHVLPCDRAQRPDRGKGRRAGQTGAGRGAGARHRPHHRANRTGRLRYGMRSGMRTSFARMRART